MTIDEKIAKEKANAEKLRKDNENCKYKSEYGCKGCADYYSKPCIECAKEHEQLAEWLKDYREMKLYHVPVVHGKWLPQFVSTRDLTNIFSCSNCNVSVRLLHKKVKCSYKYCPYCGVKMEE